jgi:hypothetical protein
VGFVLTAGMVSSISPHTKYYILNPTHKSPSVDVDVEEKDKEEEEEEEEEKKKI